MEINQEITNDRSHMLVEFPHYLQKGEIKTFYQIFKIL